MVRFSLMLSLGLLTLVGCGDDDGGDSKDAGTDAATGGDGDGGGPTAVGPGNAGASCKDSEECEAPAGGRCLEEIDPVAPFEQAIALAGPLLAGMLDGGAPPTLPEVDLTVETPGGYCSASCQEDADCGTGGSCFSLQALLGPLLSAFQDPNAPGGGGLGAIGGLLGGAGICLQPCTSDSDCREAEDYVCRGPFDDLNIQGLPDAGSMPASGLGGFADFAGLLGGTTLYCLPPQVDTEINLVPGMDGGTE